MQLAFESDRKYLHKGRGVQYFIINETKEIVAYVSMFESIGGSHFCFLIPSVLIKKYKIRAARFIKREFDFYLSELDWGLVQTVSKNDKMINRWMKFIGFKKCEMIDVPGEPGEYFVWRKHNNGS